MAKSASEQANTLPFQQVITPEQHDLGGFSVYRSLPHSEQTMVGPFIFFDHLGPAVFSPGEGVDVRPQPHINLATVTYLFEGSLLHRDSLGVVQEILPGEVNWMTAGKGVVHSERSPDEFREKEATLHAIQTWVALPKESEEVEPNFSHYGSDELPIWTEDGVTAVLIAGDFKQAEKSYSSPVTTYSPTLYLSLTFTPEGRFWLPAVTDDNYERAIYSVTAGLSINGKSIEQRRLVLLSPKDTVEISADKDIEEACCVIVGGAVLGCREKY